MAQATITPTLLAVKAGRNEQTRSFSLAVSASPATYQSPLTLDFTTTLNPSFLPAALAWQPGAVTDYSVKNGPVIYEFELIKGSALNNWGLKISTAGSELANGSAIPAAVSGATDLLIEVSVKTNKSI
jgi:hypothetical protein